MSANLRIKTFDRFSWLAVSGLVTLNSGPTIKSISSWLKHSVNKVANLPNFDALMFIFAIILAFFLSIQWCGARDGLVTTIGHSLRRTVPVFGRGAVLKAGIRSLTSPLHMIKTGIADLPSFNMVSSNHR